MEKKTICLLTKILRNHGISHCSAETFRLAKHNQTEAIVPMWNVLKDIIGTISQQHCKEKPFYQLEEHNIECASHLHHQFTPQQQLVSYVQQEFYKLGYMSLDFYQLSSNHNASSGSRDLLLAFGWLLCRIDFFGTLLKRMSFPENLALELTDTNVLISNGGMQKCPPTWNIVDCVKHLTLVHGKLMLTCRHLHALQKEQNRLMHKLHLSTQGISLQPGLNHLTRTEAKHLRSQTEEKLTSQFENLNSKIEDILNWKKSENVFWKWMESVIALKTLDSEKVISQSNSDENNLKSLGLCIPMSDKLCLQEAKKKLNETLIQYDQYVNRLDELWHKKQPTFPTQVHRQITKDIDEKLKDLDAKNNESYSQKKLAIVHQTTNQYKYCFDDPKSQISHMTATQKNHSTIIKKKDSIEENIAYVNEKNGRTKKKLKLELDSISSEFQNLICIPVYN